MFFTRSVLASAALLSFSTTTEGWVLHRKAEEHVEVKRIVADEAQNSWWKSIFGKRQDEILDCPNDQFAALLSNNPDSSVENFCNDWLNIPPTTVVTEFTPTVTITTSASETTTQTTTERILTTTTVVETATITSSASVRRRMVAAAAQIESIASSIVDSVIASGTPSSTEAATTKGANRLAAEQGLATACSCRLVQPTSTVTETFTVPEAVTSTVGVRVLRIVRQTETRTYTSTVNVRESATAEASTDASATTTADSVSSRDEETSSSAAEESSSTADASSSASVDADESSSAPEITTAPVVPTTIASGNSTSTATDGVPVVTAIPFSCDEDDLNKDVDQVVGGLRLGYSVYCNTGFVSQDRVGRPIPVQDATSCAAQCSLLNSQGAQDACQSALFTPFSDGRPGGDCELFSAEENSSVETTPAPGSIAIVHTGTFANGDECAALNATSVSIDTSAVVASITSGGVVISTPGLVTQSSGGGESRTYVSANSTDASGYVHWSWYELYASSASWWAVYETSWACSATITRTIEQQPVTTVIEGSTITSVIVTTIIGNGYTTIISGDSTTTIRGAGGAGGQTFVPATTTDGEGGITTIFSTAVEASTGTDGIVTPTPGPTLGGEGNVTVIEVFTTFFSTGTAGVVPPSASAPINSSADVETIISSTATTLTLTGLNSTFFSTGTNGVVSPIETPIVETIVSSGAVTLTLSGSNATATSNGGEGVLTPSSSVSASESSAVSSTSEDEWDTPGAYGPKTSTLIVVSSEILTITSTGAAGIETPTVITAVSSETIVVEVSNSTLSGNASIATSTSIATFNSTGSNGIITPTAVTEILTTAAGIGNITVIEGTATANSTGRSGVVPPASTLVVTETLNSTLPVSTPASESTLVVTETLNTTLPVSTSASESTLVVTETLNTTVPIPTPSTGFSIEGGGNFSTAFGTGFTTSTGASGIIPPASINSTATGPTTAPTFTGDRFGSLSRSRTTNSTGSTGFPTPSSNLTTVIATPSANTTLVLTVPLSTGFTSTIEIPVVNSSLIVESVPSPAPTPPSNETSSISVSSSEALRSGSASPPPSSIPANTTLTLTLPVSTGSTTIEIPIVNSTIVVPEITPSPEISESASTLVVTETRNITLSVPSGNITLIPPTTRPFDNTTVSPSIATSSIISESLVSINYSTVPSFSTGDLSTILPPSSTSNSTVSIETPSIPTNSTTAPPASVTIPPVSLNSTATGPTSLFNGTTFTGDRSGSLSRPSSVLLSTGTSGSFNATSTPPPFPTGNSTLPIGPTAPTTEACPSPTEFSFITREVIITTYTVETIPVVASTCISFDALPTALNGTFPAFGNTTLPTDVAVLPSAVESLASVIESLTATEAALTSAGLAPAASDNMSAVSSTTSEATASATPGADSEAAATPLSRFRRSGTLATQEQIDAACNDTNNLVLLPELSIQPNADSEGWFVSQSDPTVLVSSVVTDNGTIARFRSAFPGQTAALSQPLTLCPGTQYELSGLTRQENRRSGCTVQFRIGSNSVFTATPQTEWLERTERFTAGAGPEGASQDLTLVMSCAGFAGAAVGADAEGYMVGEVGAVSVTADQFTP